MPLVSKTGLRLAGLALIGLSEWPALAGNETPASLETIGEYAGVWQVTDAEATRACAVTLLDDEAIGGYAIDVAPDCAGKFPVMDEIAAWRMFENGDIAFADGARTERLRFYTPDEAYITVEEIDGIARLLPVSQ